MTGLPPEIRHMPIDERTGRPIPYIVERPGGIANFGVLDPRRAATCYAKRLCAMCGLKMGSQVTLYGDAASLEPDGFYIEAPIHERCAEIALSGTCPFITQESYPRRRQDDPQVAVIGERDKLREVGRSIAKRPCILAIANHYQMVTMITDYGPMPVYLAPDVVRVRRYQWVDGLASEVAPQPQPQPDPEPARQITVVRHQTRRLPRSKR